MSNLLLPHPRLTCLTKLREDHYHTRKKKSWLWRPTHTGAYMKTQPWARLAAMVYLVFLHVMLLACSSGSGRHGGALRGVTSG